MTPEIPGPVDIKAQLRTPHFLPKVAELETAFTFIGDRKRCTNDWVDFLVKEGVYEFPTEEYIDGLGAHLMGRVEELSGTPEQPVRILEVAAGKGKLSYFLQKKLEEEIPGKSLIIATDNLSWSSSSTTTARSLHVESLSYKEALEKHKPHIVIGSWIPSDGGGDTAEDWSVAFRQTPTVQEYILIGDPNHHATERAFGIQRDDWYKPPSSDFVPEYQQDGFEKVELTHLNPLQFGYMDRAPGMHSSRTITFRRQK